MYFSITSVKNDRAAQLAVMTASQLGELMMSGQQSHVAFEAAVSSISGKMNSDPAMVAAQLLNEDQDFRKKAIKVGLEEIVRSLGGEENAMAFFRQINAPKAKLRFESVGGIADDLTSAKNRSAVLAIKASGERYRNHDAIDRLPAEREYMEFLKSVSRSLDTAIVSGTVDANTAQEVKTTIEEAGYVDQRPKLKGHIIALQADASRELFQEERAALMDQYRKAAPAVEKTQSNDGPTRH